MGDYPGRKQVRNRAKRAVKMTASLSKGLPKRKQQPLRKSRRKLIRYGWTGRLLPLVLISFLASPGRAQEPLPAWSTDSCKAWWTQNSSPAQWSTAADTLDRRLAAIYQKGGASVFSLPDFQGWMEHLEWVRLGLQDPTLLSDPRRIQRFISLGEDSTISHLLVEKIEPRDVKQAALENLLHLAETQAADLHEYAALAVAYCLVFDEPFPDYWPHRQVPQSAVPIGDLDIAQRFAFYVQANRNKQTALDLSQLPFEALKYLVDSEVSLSELQYGQKSTIPYDDFGKAFFSISYDEGRLSQNGGFTWSYPTYTLDDIKTRGGICVDQAYYAFILGKGRGIPTIYFTGLGTDGGHAWFGYLERSGKWNLDCGRYASQNYPKGYALDPQTWQEIKDTTLQDLAKNGGTNPNYLPARTALAWARLHVSSPQDEQAFDDARSLMPEMAESWQAEADFMAGASTIDLQAKKDFFQQWIAQFTGYPDMKVEGQKRLEDLLKKSNDPEAAAVGQDIVLENRSTGFDLGIEGSSNAIIDKLKAGDWDGADLDFKTSVRRFQRPRRQHFLLSGHPSLRRGLRPFRPYQSGCRRAAVHLRPDDI